jgi:two-component system nitrogen regulation response regulator NtrX
MKILIVDDSVDFSSTLADIIQSFGMETAVANSPEEAEIYLERHHKNVGLILLDIEFGFGERVTGLDLLELFKQLYISIPIVMVSGKGTIETAVRATKLGAMNFIEKNIINKERIKGIIDAVFEQSSIRGNDSEIHNFLASNGIIGRSKAITEVGDNIIKYGRTNLNILITGETGTGKRLVANAIHSISRRSKENFVTVDISNIPKELFQSELFGHIKGAFPGAIETTKGFFQQADNGSLFLDDIGNLSVELQANLLVPIEEKIVRKVGAIENEEINVRVISASDKDLFNMIKIGSFREQLYHRLRECEINVPSLESRPEDIPDIINYLTAKHNSQFAEMKHFSLSVISYFAEQKWHGNVREISSVVKSILQTTQKEEIEIQDVMKVIDNRRGYFNINININSPKEKETESEIHSISLERTLKEDLAEVDKIKIEKTLEQTQGNVSKASVILGVSRETLHNKIRRYEINTQLYRSKK